MLQSRHSRIAGAFQGDPEAGGSDGLLLALSPSHGLFDIVRDYECGRERQHDGFWSNEAAWPKHQPTDVGNNRRLRSIVSGLLFTMNAATPTCRAGARSADIPHLGRCW